MLERTQTYALDAADPNIELLRRVLRLGAALTVAIAIVLLAGGAIDVFVFAALLVASVIEAAAVPFALATLRTSITIDPNGLTLPGRRATVVVPWSDIETVEVRSGTPESTRWLFDLLRVNTAREYAHVGIRENSATRRERQYLKGFSFYMRDPEQFVHDADELRTTT
jgi:hypothetical protein